MIITGSQGYQIISQPSKSRHLTNISSHPPPPGAASRVSTDIGGHPDGYGKMSKAHRAQEPGLSHPPVRYVTFAKHCFLRSLQTHVGGGVPPPLFSAKERGQEPFRNPYRGFTTGRPPLRTAQQQEAESWDPFSKAMAKSQRLLLVLLV